MIFRFWGLSWERRAFFVGVFLRGGSTCRVIGVGLLALEVDLLAERLGTCSQS